MRGFFIALLVVYADNKLDLEKRLLITPQTLNLS